MAGTAARNRTRDRTAAVAAAAALAGALAGCSGPGAGPGPAAASSAAQAMQAEALATQEFGQLSGGGWAQAWSLWAPASQHLVDEADYVAVNKACPPALGVPYVIEKTVPDGADTMQVTWQRGTATGTNVLIYQDHAWRFVPATDEVAQYQLGPSKAIAQRKAAGRCR